MNKLHTTDLYVLKDPLGIYLAYTTIKRTEGRTSRQSFQDLSQGHTVELPCQGRGCLCHHQEARKPLSQKPASTMASGTRTRTRPPLLQQRLQTEILLPNQEDVWESACLCPQLPFQDHITSPQSICLHPQIIQFQVEFFKTTSAWLNPNNLNLDTLFQGILGCLTFSFPVSELQEGILRQVEKVLWMPFHGRCHSPVTYQISICNLPPMLKLPSRYSTKHNASTIIDCINENILIIFPKEETPNLLGHAFISK